MDFIRALAVADKVFELYKIEEYKWWRKLDGTPMLNSLSVRMAEAFRDEFDAADPAPLVAQASPDNSEVPYLIVFDDTDRENELVIGDWRAAIRFKQISMSWNAHLFVRVAGNSYGDKTPRYQPEASPLVEDAQRIVAGKVDP